MPGNPVDPGAYKTTELPRRRPSDGPAVNSTSDPRRASALSNTADSLSSLSSASTGLTLDSHDFLVPCDTACSDTDSVVSIVDDPFFQRLDPALEASASSNCAPGLQCDSDGNSTDQCWPPPRRESLTIGLSQYHWVSDGEADDGDTPSHSTSSPFSARDTPTSPEAAAERQVPADFDQSTMEVLNIAVIGSSAAGKSSFIQNALGYSRLPVSNATSAQVPVDNATHSITLLELDLACFVLKSPQPITWPKKINGTSTPRVDAALVLYDVVNQESICGLSQLIAALTSSSGLPVILVACKCDSPKDDWEVDADAIANHKVFKPCLASFKTSMERPDISRKCLLNAVRAAIGHRRDDNGEAVSRRRAQSAANLEAPDPTAGRPLSEHSKHSRASSDWSSQRGLLNPQASENYRSQSSRGMRPGFRVERPGGESFLELDESDAESHEYADDIPILQRGDDHVIERQPKPVGVTFDELVDRLLAMRLSKADNNFSDIFLCLYRKFAAPGDLFSAILVRLDRARDDKTAHYLTKTATQLRIIEVVAKWVSLYPGDFARPTTRRNLEDFIMHLSTEPVFSIASQQMRRNLQFNVIVDDDTGWANADDAGDEIASKILSKDMGQLSDGIGTLQLSDEADGRPSNSSETSAPDKGSIVGSQSFFSSYDEHERHAALLEPTDLQPMSKVRYHNFKDISDDEIANELTRIDWTMFSSIRIRDFVRHVSLSAAEKEKCKSLRNINRMINHFNHIAKWVANMILLKDKPKHRAQMLEKFMNIALKLRKLNNYNGLAAVLAGITGSAIHRLAQTRALVPASVQKRFTRLVILMGTQKSHFAYRLAWENSPLPRIPFIPLHLRDLVSAEEGGKTFVGSNADRINWKKFEVLAEVLLPMMRSQGTAYPALATHDTARDLILGCRMPTDDEEIYQRSLQVESNSSGPVDPSKKKFPWFAK